MEQAVGADRRVVQERRLAVAVGECAAGRLDDRLQRGEVVRSDADRVDRDVERSLGDQHVLPEVAEPT